MDKTQIGMCGAYCGTCKWKAKTGCAGCQACGGKMFWGTCAVAACCLGKGISHCGHCKDLPCDLLEGFFNNGEHGDNGERLANLKAWAAGKDEFIELGTFPAKGR
jgi:hypothetical protein